MKTLIVAGALGSNAQFKCENGREYIQFSVADNQSWVDRDGNRHDEVQWIACFLNGRNEKLLPYLVKGQQVIVFGRMSTRVYSSKQARALVAGVDVNVDRIEFIGGKPDSVPRELFDQDGQVHKVLKFYRCEDVKACTLMSRKGDFYIVDSVGLVNPMNGALTNDPQIQEDSPQVEEASDEKFEVF